MTDNKVTPFPMPGAREVVELSGGALQIEKQVAALEESVFTQPSLAFDLAKSLIESVCKTILTDRGVEFDKNINFPSLTQLTIETIQLLPDGYTEAIQIKQCIERTLNGFVQIFSGIGELRNKEGLASHGKDGYKPMLDTLQAQLMARASDAVVNYLYKAHRGYSALLPTRGLDYTDNPDLNNYLDDIFGEIIIFDNPYRASEILFNLDPTAYMTVLSEYEVPDDDNPGGEEIE